MSWFGKKESTLELELQSKCSALESKYGALESKYGALESKYGALESKYAELESRLNSNSNSNLETVLWHDGSLYQGKMVNQKPHGYGIICHGDGSRYVGGWKNGMYDGFGVFYYPGFPPWNAEWKEHKPHGNCTYDFVNYDNYIEGVLQKTL